jgi:DNA (cytosine-5)-methyltransferase 1
MTTYTSLGMFSGAGGLDLGFEIAGFAHVGAMDWERWCVDTMMKNRPGWSPVQADAREWSWDEHVDVLVAGPPCQGYSLGGNREATDDRNLLYREVIRVANSIRPRAVVIENVLNLRTMHHPEVSVPFDQAIAQELAALGYAVDYGVFRMDGYGVPQTRRRFVFVAMRDGFPEGWRLPEPEGREAIRSHIWDLGQGSEVDLPNHDPKWGFASSVHQETGEAFDPAEEAVVVRFSRTASDGNPIRSFDQPMPAIDSATIWGWAQGNVEAVRKPKDRTGVGARFIRNPEATVTLWRVSASKLRAMTHREFARLQTFPDDWAFVGNNKRDVHLQIGNAVPVEFARRLGESVQEALRALDDGRLFVPASGSTGVTTLF